ncbi:MAG: hypothetical protein [Microvirus sp.]|nr:MAG: hypothetical protein [Microvirus sp.]
MPHSNWIELLITLASSALSYIGGHYVGKKKGQNQ